MTLPQLSRIWSLLGAFVAFYAINAWIVSQGGKPFFGGPIMDDRKGINEYFACAIVGFPLFLLTIVGTLYALRSTKSRWAGRLPVVGLQELDLRRWDAKFYQLFFVLLYLIIPMASLWHFQLELFEVSRVVRKQKSDFVGRVETVDFFVMPSIMEWNDNNYCMGPDLAADNFQGDPCKPRKATATSSERLGGVTWIPFVSPIIVVWLPLVLSILGFAAQIYAVFWREVPILRRREE